MRETGSVSTRRASTVVLRSVVIVSIRGRDETTVTCSVRCTAFGIVTTTCAVCAAVALTAVTCCGRNPSACSERL